MEWQSEQEKKESKSIYHSEKEDSYIPLIPKAVEGKIDEVKPSETCTINVNKVLTTSEECKTKDDKNTKKVTKKTS